MCLTVTHCPVNTQIFHDIAVSASDEFLLEYLPQLLEVCVRLYQTMDSTDDPFVAETKVASDELMKLLEKRLGTGPFVGAFQSIQRRLQGNKFKRKQEIAVEAVVDPASYAERKVCDLSYKSVYFPLLV